MTNQIAFSLLLVLFLFFQGIACAQTLVPKEENGLWGYVNDRGEFVLPPQWNSAGEFRSGRVARISVSLSDSSQLYGLIDSKGQYIVEPIYNNILEGESGVYFGGEDGFYIIFKKDQEGNTREGIFDIKYMSFTSPAFEEIIPYCRNSENLLRVYDPDTHLQGYINTQTGKLDIPCIFSETCEFSEGVAICWLPIEGAGAWGRCVIVTPQRRLFLLEDGLDCPDWEIFSDGLAVVVDRSNKYGFINYTGQIVIPCSFDYAEQFYEGLAIVGSSDKYGYIDEEGENVIPCIFDHATHFENGIAYVIFNGECRMIDKQGNFLD